MRKFLVILYLLANFALIGFAYYAFTNKVFFNLDEISSIILSKIFQTTAGHNIDLSKEKILVLNIDNKYNNLYNTLSEKGKYNKIFSLLPDDIGLLVLSNKLNLSSTTIKSEELRKFLMSGRVVIGSDKISKRSKIIAYEKYSKTNFSNYSYLLYKKNSKLLLPLPYLVYLKMLPGFSAYKLLEKDNFLMVDPYIIKGKREIPLVKTGYIYSTNLFNREYIKKISAFDFIKGNINLNLENYVVFLSNDNILDSTYANISNYLSYKYNIFYKLVDYNIIFYFLFFLIFILSFSYFLYKNTLFSFVFSIIFLFLSVFLYFFVYYNLGYFIPVISLFIVIIIKGFLDILFYIFFLVQKKREVSNLFSTYVSDDLLKKKETNMYKKVSENIDIFILFTDIEKFTNLSEKLSAEQVLKLLEEYFSILGEKIQKSGGYIDKYIGDAILAYWKDYNYSDKILETVLYMSSKKTKLIIENRIKVKYGIDVNLNTRFGLHYGSVIAGDLGGYKTKAQYTILGDNVNLSSRLESLNKFYGTNVIISESVVNKILYRDVFIWRFLDKVKVKGKQNAVKIYELVGLSKDFVSYKDYFKEYDKGIYYYLSGNFENAYYILFNLLNTEYGIKDKVLNIMIERIKKLKENPPENWDGVWVYDKK